MKTYTLQNGHTINYPSNYEVVCFEVPNKGQPYIPAMGTASKLPWADHPLIAAEPPETFLKKHKDYGYRRLIVKEIYKQVDPETEVLIEEDESPPETTEPQIKPEVLPVKIEAPEVIYETNPLF